MTFIYMIMIVVLLILFVFALQRQIKYYRTLTPVMGWLAGLFFFIVLPLTFIILNQGYEKPGYPLIAGLWGMITTRPSTFLQPFLMIWLTLVLTNLTVIFFTPRYITRNEEAIQSNKKWIVSIIQLKRILLTSILISFIFFGINIFLGGGLSNYFSQHWYFRFDEYSQKLGLLFTFYLKVYSTNQIILASATGLLIVSAINKQWQNNYRLLAFSILTMLLHMVMSGNRIYIAVVFIYMFTAMISFLDAKKLIKFSLYLLPIVPIFSIWAYIRGNIVNLSAALQNYATTINQASSKIMTTMMDLTEGSDSMVLIKVMHDFGNTQPFLHGETYLKALTSVLPIAHVESLSITLAKIYQPGIPSSMNSTALGEMWANFGYFTILLIPLFTFLIMGIGNYLYNHLNKRVLLNSVLFVILIWMARSVFADNFQLLVLSFLMIWGFRYEKNLYYCSHGNKIHPASSTGDEQLLPS